MRFIISALVFLSFTMTVAYAGDLSGRIIKDEGSPLANTEVSIDNEKIKTNEFGGYRVKLQDGKRELNIKFGGDDYTSEIINIYSPEVKQNWKVDSKNRKFVKIR